MTDETLPAVPAIEEPNASVSDEHYVLRLYVTGTTPRSTRAIENMHEICEQHLQGRFDLEVIDIYQNPEASREAQIIAAPTLVKMLPEPLRRVIGDLSDHEKVLAGLNLRPTPLLSDEKDA